MSVADVTLISIGPQIISAIDTKRESITEEEETLKGKLLVCICLIVMFAVLNFTVAVMETLVNLEHFHFCLLSFSGTLLPSFQSFCKMVSYLASSPQRRTINRI